ncbi:Pex12 amino terminal region-domain-containing protein [Kockiozyma suomiensis]|uniref:Pex12 amino terminal region-domain-containing protein n=1 Tax=Kockiozyma suomiensis TaxID=1337062 RepID=UPI003343C24F
MSHLSTLNPLLLDPSRPSLFELVSASQLSDLLSPTARYILASLAARRPRYLLRLVLYFDELYATLSGIIELRCLTVWNASFTESFYDLARRRVVRADRAVVAASGDLKSVQEKVDKLAELRSRDVYASLFALVGLPYIVGKCDLYYESLQTALLFRARSDDGEETNQTRLQKAKKLVLKWFTKLYPSMKLSASGISLLLSILYLFGRTPYNSVTDFLLGIRYTRQTQRQKLTSSLPLSAPAKISVLRNLMRILLKGFDMALRGALPIAVFSLKLLEWWHASDFPRQLAQSTRRRQRELQIAEEEEDRERTQSSSEEKSTKYALDPPEQPQRLSMPLTTSKVGNEKATDEACVLCGHRIKEPTAIETGRVFCYACIYGYITSHPAPTADCVDVAVRCPVTHQRLLGVQFETVSGRWLASGLRRLIV